MTRDSQMHDHEIDEPVSESQPTYCGAIDCDCETVLGWGYCREHLRDQAYDLLVDLIGAQYDTLERTDPAAFRLLEAVLDAVQKDGDILLERRPYKALSADQLMARMKRAAQRIRLR